MKAFGAVAIRRAMFASFENLPGSGKGSSISHRHSNQEVQSEQRPGFGDRNARHERLEFRRLPTSLTCRANVSLPIAGTETGQAEDGPNAVMKGEGALP